MGPPSSHRTAHRAGRRYPTPAADRRVLGIMAGYLAQRGTPIGFGQRMLLGLPIAAVFMIIAWVLLTRACSPASCARSDPASCPGTWAAPVRWWAPSRLHHRGRPGGRLRRWGGDGPRQARPVAAGRPRHAGSHRRVHAARRHPTQRDRLRVKTPRRRSGGASRRLPQPRGHRPQRRPPSTPSPRSSPACSCGRHRSTCAGAFRGRADPRTGRGSGDRSGTAARRACLRAPGQRLRPVPAGDRRPRRRAPSCGRAVQMSRHGPCTGTAGTRYRRRPEPPSARHPLRLRRQDECSRNRRALPAPEARNASRGPTSRCEEPDGPTAGLPRSATPSGRDPVRTQPAGPPSTAGPRAGGAWLLGGQHDCVVRYRSRETFVGRQQPAAKTAGRRNVQRIPKW